VGSPSHPSQERRFGIFELDPETQQVRKAGLSVRLQPQPFKVLALLVSRAGRVVTREELRHEVWGNETFVDFEQGLNYCIRQIRAVLGDEAQTPRYVETIARRGYRFIAPVEGNGESARSDSRPETGPEKKKTAGVRIWLILVGIALILVLAAVGYLARVRSSVHLFHGASASSIRSLAVLPLENLSRDADQEYFADGMTDELITELAQIRALRVISRSSVMGYKTKRATTPQIARELNVDGLVEGTVLRSGERVRITAQLIDARTDRHLWAHSYERDLRDVLALQSEVASAIANEIKIEVTPQEQMRLASARPVDPEAHEAYLKGRYHWNQRICEELREGLRYFELARGKDPTWALSYVGVADSYTLMPGYCQTNAEQALPRARAAALKALEIDDSLAEAHASLGAVHQVELDWGGEEREFRRAIELNPNYATAHHWYGLYFSALGRHEEALAEIKRALELDPLSPIVSGAKAIILFNARKYQETVEWCQKAIELDPNWPGFHFWLGAAYLEEGMFEKGVAEHETASNLLKNNTRFRGGLGYAYGVAGKKDEAHKILNELKTLSKQSYVPSLNIGLVYLGLGEKEQALTSLEKAYEEGGANLFLAWVNVLPWFDNLRSEPRYRALLRRMDLPLSARSR